MNISHNHQQGATANQSAGDGVRGPKDTLERKNNKCTWRVQ